MGQVAVVKQAMISPIRDRFSVKIKKGPDLEVKGNTFDRESTIGEVRDQVAEISKEWYRTHESYAFEIDLDQDDAVILA